MGYLSKALVTGGLVILTGPLCLLAVAQTYVDVEAERAAASSGASRGASGRGFRGGATGAGVCGPALPMMSLRWASFSLLFVVVRWILPENMFQALAFFRTQR